MTEIDEEYKQNALDKIKNLVNGNDCAPGDVTLQSFEGEVLHFQATNTLTILTKLGEKHIPGRIEGPVKVDNETAAKTAINNAYKNLSEDSNAIRETILNREDKGFGVHHEHIPLPFFKKEFVIFDPCQTCKTTGVVTCLPCGGKGQSQCPKCHGSGMGQCHHCNGTQMINGPNNQRIQCPICHGAGRTSCNQCQQAGTIQCKTCRSAGTTPCSNCNGNAWTSHIHIMEIEAHTNFDVPRETLPDKVVNMIDKHGAKIKDHAKIIMVNPEHPPRQETEHVEIPMIYDVTLPYAHLEYAIKGTTYYTFLFGTQNRMTHTSPFLDDLIKEGLRKLKDAAGTRGDVTKNLKAASQFRTVKESIIAAALHSKAKAQKALKAKNPIGLSDGAIQNMIETADTALQNITRKPRTLGLIYGAILNVALISGYFFIAREIIISKLANPMMHYVIDALILATIAYLGIFTIQITAASALKSALTALGINTSAPPKLGNMLYYSLGLSAALFAGLYITTL